MANPNKTVEKAAKKRPYVERPARPQSEFTAWLLADQARTARFPTLEAARKEFESTSNHK